MTSRPRRLRQFAAAAALVAGAALLPLVPRAAAATSPSGFVTYRVFATQYAAHDPASAEVAVPDKCAKFAALGWTTTLTSHKCPSGYSTSMDWRVHVLRDGGQAAYLPVRDVGPWNLDDNWWNPASGPRPRRLFADLPQGKPEAQAAYQDGYNTIPDCANLDGSSSGRSGAADQFGRCVKNPAGIDISVEAARRLGLAYLQNEWVTVTFMWEGTSSTTPSPTPTPTPTPTGGGRLQGKVQASDGSALAGATVCATGPQPGTTMTCADPTNRKGRYRVALPAGIYGVAATAPGLDCHVGRADGPTAKTVTVTDGGRVRVSFVCV